ncbi:hypothetical protein ACHAW6_015603 [Cyclotella cf. meneghiniana]
MHTTITKYLPLDHLLQKFLKPPRERNPMSSREWPAETTAVPSQHCTPEPTFVHTSTKHLHLLIPESCIVAWEYLNHFRQTWRMPGSQSIHERRPCVVLGPYRLWSKIHSGRNQCRFPIHLRWSSSMIVLFRGRCIHSILFRLGHRCHL